MVYFVSRAECGLVQPVGSLTPRTVEPVGITVHYTTGEELGNERTREWWKAIQSYHLSQGYADIAYNGGFDIYGTCFEGRSNDVVGAHAATEKPHMPNANLYFLGIAFMGDDDPVQDVTPQAAEALVLWLNLFRLRYGKIPLLTVHSDFKATACPGNELRDVVRFLKRTPLAW